MMCLRYLVTPVGKIETVGNDGAIWQMHSAKLEDVSVHVIWPPVAAKLESNGVSVYFGRRRRPN